MYTPPYSVSDEALSLLVRICSQLPECDADNKAPDWDVHSLCSTCNARLRNSGEKAYWVPVLLESLLSWLKQTQCHPVVRAAVFHYELISIGVFEENNKESALQLLHTLLSTYHPIFRRCSIHLPSPACECALAAPDATEFITLSLHAILDTLNLLKNQSARAPRTTRKVTPAEQLLNYLKKHPGSKRNDLLHALPALSARMMDRHLVALKDSGQIEYRGSRKTGAYYPMAATR